MTEETHPITPEMRAEILARLDAIEKEHGVNVLYACESGSRGWGFASPDSDYDVRFIYVPRLPWYFRLGAQRDVIEQPISDALDRWLGIAQGAWAVEKGQRHAHRMADLPIAYRSDEKFLAALRDCVRQVNQPPHASGFTYIKIPSGNADESSFV